MAALEAALSLAVSSARASQKARCVMKLSLLLVRTDVVTGQSASSRNATRRCMDYGQASRNNNEGTEETTCLEKSVPQSHLYSLVPQVLACAFQSDCTA